MRGADRLSLPEAGASSLDARDGRTGPGRRAVLLIGLLIGKSTWREVRDTAIVAAAGLAIYLLWGSGSRWFRKQQPDGFPQ